MRNDYKVITTKIQSRHKSSKKYRVNVQYSPTNHQETERSDRINVWYCECKNGARTLGCCCHVAALIYYLANARHITHQSLTKPAFFLNSIFLNSEVRSSQSGNESDASLNIGKSKSKQQKRRKDSKNSISSSEYANEESENE